jgi:hypothetical protein
MNKKLAVKPWSPGALPSGTNESLAGSGATFSYAVTGNINGGYIVESIGKYGRAEKTVRSVLRLDGLFEEAIFTQGDIVLKSGTVVDMYNNDADDTLRIGTTGTRSGAISMSTGAVVEGDVVVGVGGDPEAVISAGGATITGETYALTDEIKMPAVTVPQSLMSMPSKGTIKNPGTIKTSGKYDNIYLGNGDVVKIDGPVSLYVLGDIGLSNSAQLQIVNTNPNASLTLYLGGQFNTKNGGTINNLSADPRKLKIYGLNSCSSMNFATGGVFYGAIYAPNSAINFKSSIDIYGAVVGKTFNLASNSELHYDALLRDVSVNDVGVRFVTTQWYEE